MAYDPIENFDVGQIPDTENETTFHDDATYVFSHLASEIIPGINGAISWMNAALPGDVSTVIDALAAVTAKSGRNAIINGCFRIWQTSTSFAGVGYTADQWVTALAGGKTQTVSRQDFALGQSDVAGNPKHYLRAVVGGASATNALASIKTRIEGVDTFSGRDCTLSFDGKVDSAKDVAIRITQNFGTGGSPSADVVTVPASNIALGTSWDRHSATVTLPSVSGKVLGSANDDYLEVEIVFAAGTSFDAETNSLGDQSGTFEIANVQLEPGAAASDFERRTEGEELVLCRRFYQEFPYRARFWAVNASSADGRVLPIPTVMRSTPVVTRGTATSTNVASITTDPSGNDGVSVVVSPLASGATSSEFRIGLSARL